MQPPTQPPPEVFRTCDNCGRDVLAANFLVHEAHCCRHFKRCEHCGKCLELSALEAHRDEMRGSISLLAAALEAGEAARVCSALDHGGAELLDSAAGVERKGWFAGWSKARQCAGCLR